MTRIILMAAALLAGFAILNIHIAQADGRKSVIRNEPKGPIVAEHIDIAALAERLRIGAHGVDLPWITNDGGTRELPAPAGGDRSGGTTGHGSNE